MDNKSLYKLLKQKIDENKILQNESMTKHTSFKLGGPADFFLIPSSIDELKEIFSIIKEQDVPYYILGNGSNVLVKDGGFRGIIIQIYKNMNKCKIEGEKIYAQGGILLSSLSRMAAKESLSGLEFANGIPGTLGGAVFMNAGAYGGEMKQVISKVKVLFENGEIKTLKNDEMDFGYRKSILAKNKGIVLDVEIKLQKSNQEDIYDKMNDLNDRRKEKQPLNMPSAGSTFKRPEGYYAGKLIMDAGLKGYKVGGAKVSEKHCGFVVNTGNATSKDILKLIEYIRNTVHEKFGVWLEREVRIIGEEV